MANVTKISPFKPEKYAELYNVKGLQIGTTCCGFYKTGKPDLMVVTFEKQANIAAVFTRSTMASYPVLWGREALKKTGGKASALVVNSGNSLAMAGKFGIEAVESIKHTTSQILRCSADEIYTSSTGVIGQPFESSKICDKIESALEKRSDFFEACEAIETTDTFHKVASVKTRIGEADVVITGICKGSGMIEPNMATMLAYVFTDANISSNVLQELLNECSDKSFNSITVDGDSSTSDTLMLIATKAAGNAEITNIDDPLLAEFKTSLLDIMRNLAKQIVSDGEGAQKFITINISGAMSVESAKKVGKGIGNSPLVKTAIAGEDANWGRLAMAIGKTLEPVNLQKLCINYGGQDVVINGEPNPDYSESFLTKHLQGRYVDIAINLGVGGSCATIWTCDFTHEYIAINADYRS